jgi:hypothetical protein
MGGIPDLLGLPTSVIIFPHQLMIVAIMVTALMVMRPGEGLVLVDKLAI